MGDAENCCGVGQSCSNNLIVAVPLTPNGSSKKENGYSKRVSNGNNIEEQVCHIFGFPCLDRPEESVQPDIFVTEKGGKFIGEVKSVKGDRVVVWVRQFDKYRNLANFEESERNKLFYFFAKYTDGSKPSIDDIYVVDYERMKYFMAAKENVTTGWGLKRRYSRKIKHLKDKFQDSIDDSGNICDGINKKSDVGKKAIKSRKKEIVEKYNKKGPYIRIKISELEDCCNHSKIITDRETMRSIAIHYENVSMDFINNARYPERNMRAHKISHVQQALL